jgi:hypothetical protein
MGIKTATIRLIIGRYNSDGPTVQPCLSGGCGTLGPASAWADDAANWLIGQVRNETQDDTKFGILAVRNRPRGISGLSTKCHPFRNSSNVKIGTVYPRWTAVL